mgnify:CR=1 FL=1
MLINDPEPFVQEVLIKIKSLNDEELKAWFEEEEQRIEKMRYEFKISKGMAELLKEVIKRAIKRRREILN